MPRRQRQAAWLNEDIGIPLDREPDSCMFPDLPSIPALTSRTGASGHQFVVYGDSCSGVPDALHERTSAAVNSVVARLAPQPEWICFLGDEVIGLTTDECALRAQWAHWFDHEMAWLDGDRIPMYHTTANHTTYDRMSERVYASVMEHLPDNGPADQRYLSYSVRKGVVAMIFINTMWTELGEGRVETAWLRKTLAEHADARYRFVFGHHPVFSVNGFAGPYQRDIEPGNGRELWEIFREFDVTAYWCSHMLAFDVQVHGGILQILTAGAGTAHRMPEESEYLHAVQAAIDDLGLRYQVIDDRGVIRERLSWPPMLATADSWPELPPSVPLAFDIAAILSTAAVAFAVDGVACPVPGGSQTLVACWNDGPWLPPLWVGLIGPEQRLGMLLAPRHGRSPHLVYGPEIAAGVAFSLEIMIHPDMGPGGVLWRLTGEEPWESMTGASAWGAERLPSTSWLSIGQATRNPDDRPFLGTNLHVRMTTLDRWS